MCIRVKLRGSPKALVTKVIKETLLLAPLMPGGMVTSLKISVMEWVIADLNQIIICKRATSRRLFSIYYTVRCTLVAGKAGSWEKLSNPRLKITQ